jgi:hypothetical protein
MGAAAMSTEKPGPWEAAMRAAAGYGSIPRMKPYGNRSGVCIHEIHAEIAEYRLAHDGIKPELLAYLAGIGAAHG